LQGGAPPSGRGEKAFRKTVVLYGTPVDIRRPSVVVFSEQIDFSRF
jgi:hypothetical protein